MIVHHIPVLLNAVMDTLENIENRTIVDCTFGAGGYSRAFLNAGANVIAFDRDITVVEEAKKIQQQYGDKFRFINSSFKFINILSNKEFDDVVFDLGISSMQIDNADRGFSFKFNGPLDMRMDLREQITAIDVIKNTSEEELANILYKYGDIKKSKIIAHVLKENLPTTTFQLKQLINNQHDVAPIFQALRIAVNNEFEQLISALNTVHSMLRPGGRCICVTFHSIEDRIVKNTFKDWSKTIGNPKMPLVIEPNFKLLKTCVPSKQEISNNFRARSAHMRAVEKL